MTHHVDGRGRNGAAIRLREMLQFSAKGEETMRRREFIGLVAGAAGAWTCADVFAAQKSPIARIGYLSTAATPNRVLRHS